jgi:tetratricopeptide (TPR) repeat protein
MSQETEPSPPVEHDHRRKELIEKAWHGVALCRAGEWEDGVAYLARVDELSTDLDRIPALADSYLGFGWASQGGKYAEGLSKCQAAVDKEGWEVEAYQNLARTYLLRRNKKAAIATLDRGLEVDPVQKELLALRAKFGYRRKPMIPFLPRGQFLNKFVGILRHNIRGGLKPKLK